jgi:hypothetical protein
MLKRYGDVNFPRPRFYKNRVTIRDIKAKIWEVSNMGYTDLDKLHVLYLSRQSLGFFRYFG